MNEKIVLAQVATEVMARFALIFGDIVTAEELKPSGSKFTSIEINFEKGGENKLGMAADEEFITMLAASSLGTNEKDTVAKANKYDACMELMNLICGNFIATFRKKGFEGKIGLPQIKEISAEKWKELLKKDGIGFLVEGYPVYYYFEKE